jgi:hypothetical protein
MPTNTSSRQSLRPWKPTGQALADVRLHGEQDILDEIDGLTLQLTNREADAAELQMI